MGQMGEEERISTEKQGLGADTAANPSPSMPKGRAVNAKYDEILYWVQRRERRFQMSSGVAYVLFTLLLGGAFGIVFKSNLASFKAAKEKLVLEKEDALKLRDEAAEMLQRKLSDEKSAMEFYREIEAKRDENVVNLYSSLASKQLSASEARFFKKEFANAKTRLATSGMAEGKKLLQHGKYQSALDVLERTLQYNDETDFASAVAHYKGMAFFKLGKTQKAILEFEKALRGRPQEHDIYTSQFMLAEAKATNGELRAARQDYLMFTNNFPDHELAKRAHQKARQIRLQIESP